MSLHTDVAVARGALDLRARVSVEDGDTLAILGPNGSGKSTLLAALAGLIPGAPHAISAPNKVGVVFQHLRLFPTMSAMENVAFPLRARRVPRAEARERAKALLSRVGLPGGRMDARPDDLSGGEAQRVAIARALITEPAVLLLDEPTSSLDITARSEIRSLLGGVLAAHAGVCVLVTHDAVEALTLGDTIMILEGGAVTQIGTPADIRERPRSHYAADLAGVNLFVGSLTPLDAGTGRLLTSDGDLIVAWPPELTPTAIDRAVAILRPADVTLHTEAPAGGSARNIFHGPIAGLSLESDRARVRVAAAPPVVAEVTLGSVERLGLREGLEVWASAKAVEVRVERG